MKKIILFIGLIILFSNKTKADNEAEYITKTSKTVYSVQKLDTLAQQGWQLIAVNQYDTGINYFFKNNYDQSFEFISTIETNKLTEGVNKVNEKISSGWELDSLSLSDNLIVYSFVKNNNREFVYTVAKHPENLSNAELKKYSNEGYQLITYFQHDGYINYYYFIKFNDYKKQPVTVYKKLPNNSLFILTDYTKNQHLLFKDSKGESRVLMNKDPLVPIVELFQQQGKILLGAGEKVIKISPADWDQTKELNFQPAEKDKTEEVKSTDKNQEKTESKPETAQEETITDSQPAKVQYQRNCLTTHYTLKSLPIERHFIIVNNTSMSGLFFKKTENEIFQVKMVYGDANKIQYSEPGKNLRLEDDTPVIEIELK